jgi:hypothetical protein
MSTLSVFTAPCSPFVEQDVGVRRYVLPWREGARRLLMGRSFLLVVQIGTQASAAVGAVLPEQRFKLFEQVRVRAEVAEVLIAGSRFARHHRLHFLAVVAMEGISFDDHRIARLRAGKCAGRCA